MADLRRHSQRPAVESEPSIEEIIRETIEVLQVRCGDFLDATKCLRANIELDIASLLATAGVPEIMVAGARIRYS
jgi:hypothetical protein